MTAFTENLFSIDKRVVLVTGASRGIGLMLVNSLAEAGANVIGIARSETASSSLVNGASYKQCDVTDKQKFQEVCQNVADEFGCIDALINCAGISLSSDSLRDESNFDQTIAVNLKAAYTGSMTVAGFMKKSKAPSIINITSINSFVGFPGNPGYVAAKGGLRMLTKALAVDLIENNIRVNAIAPGYIHTDMTNKSHSDPELHTQRLKHMIIPRWGKADDLVGAAIFLISNASAYITGQDIVVDGGWTAKGLIS